MAFVENLCISVNLVDLSVVVQLCLLVFVRGLVEV